MAQGSRRSPSGMHRGAHFDIDELARRVRKSSVAQAEFVHKMESGVRGRPRKERAVQLPNAGVSGTKRVRRIRSNTLKREAVRSSWAEAIGSTAFVAALGVYAVVWMVDFFSMVFPHSPAQSLSEGISAGTGDILSGITDPVAAVAGLAMVFLLGWVIYSRLDQTD